MHARLVYSYQVQTFCHIAIIMAQNNLDILMSMQRMPHFNPLVFSYLLFVTRDRLHSMKISLTHTFSQPSLYRPRSCGECIPSVVDEGYHEHWPISKKPIYQSSLISRSCGIVMYLGPMKVCNRCGAEVMKMACRSPGIGDAE
jgi:hypothetical protein